MKRECMSMAQGVALPPHPLTLLYPGRQLSTPTAIEKADVWSVLKDKWIRKKGQVIPNLGDEGRLPGGSGICAGFGQWEGYLWAVLRPWTNQCALKQGTAVGTCSHFSLNEHLKSLIREEALGT